MPEAHENANAERRIYDDGSEQEARMVPGDV